MTDCRTVYIARHGERLDHIGSEWKGKYPHLDFRDSPLSPLGIRQSQELAYRMKAAKLRNPVIFASPFFRTVQTAFEICKVLGAPMYCEWGFVENLGKGKFSEVPDVCSPEQLARDFDCVDQKYESQWKKGALRAGETDADIAKRTSETVNALLKKHDGDIVIVSHSSICRILVQEMMKANREVNPKMGSTPLRHSYCSLSCVKVILDPAHRSAPLPQDTTPAPSPRSASIRRPSFSRSQPSGYYYYILEHVCDVSHLSSPFSPNNLRRVIRQQQLKQQEQIQDQYNQLLDWSAALLADSALNGKHIRRVSAEAGLTALQAMV